MCTYCKVQPTDTIYALGANTTAQTDSQASMSFDSEGVSLGELRESLGKITWIEDPERWLGSPPELPMAECP